MSELLYADFENPDSKVICVSPLPADVSDKEYECIFRIPAFHRKYFKFSCFNYIFYFSLHCTI